MGIQMITGEVYRQQKMPFSRLEIGHQGAQIVVNTRISRPQSIKY